MVRRFTYCWRYRAMLRHPAGTPVRFVYGAQFSARGVCPDDELYIVSVHQGHVYLLGKMLAGPVTYCAAHYLERLGAEPPLALEYVIADFATPAQLSVVPAEVTRRMRFRRGKEFVGLALVEGGKVDRQSLRGVRRLSAASAEALDELMPPMVPLPARAASSAKRLVPAQVSACHYCALRGRSPRECRTNVALLGSARRC